MKVKATIIAVLFIFLANGWEGYAQSNKTAKNELVVLVLLGEWFGDSYFPLKEEIHRRGWTLKRVGVDTEYRGCYNKARDVVLRSDILIPELKDFSDFSCLIIPSGPQWRKFNRDQEVLTFIREAHDAGLLIASFCVGNRTVQAAGLIDSSPEFNLYPKKVTRVKERILLGPRGGGPPPGDGYKSAPIKAICDAIARELEYINSNGKTALLGGPYLGQKPPGNTPQIFAPNIVSKPGEIEFACAVSPCGKEIYFTRFFPKTNRSVIMVTLLRGDWWTIPKPAEFSGKYRDREPFISPDNRRLFFTSDRPGLNSNKLQKGDIWYVMRTVSGWSDPINAGPEINTDDREGHPTIARSKTIYFHRVGKNSYDIFRAESVNGKYNPAEKLGDAINTTDFIEGEPFVAPDESFLIFVSAGRADRIAADSNTCDLYISFRKNNGEWTPAKIMGSKVLSESEENWPRVSPDGKYLFFSSNRDKNPPFPDIYWINAGIIDELKPEDLK